MVMDITYDPSKDKLNIAKHGVSLKEAVNINWATFKKEIDRRHDYGEPRFIAVSYTHLTLPTNREV